MPGSHGVQIREPALDAYVPRGQGTQASELELLVYVPGAQGVHVDASEVENEPGGQEVHVILPGLEANVPDAHGRQLTCPVNDWESPGAHKVQLDDP